MNSQELRALHEAYSQVYELDEEAPKRIKKSSKNPRLMDDAGPARIHNPSLKKVEEETDLYDAILSHLLDEGFASDEKSAEAILGAMSESWVESIVEEVLDERRYDRDEPLPGSGKTPREKMERKRGQHGARVMLGNPALGRSARNDPEKDSYRDRASMMDRVKKAQDAGEEPRDDEGRKNRIKAARRPRASYERQDNRPGGLRAGNTKAGGYRTLKRKED